jgi:hypothetical protein
VDLITPLITAGCLRRMVKDLWGAAPPESTLIRPPLTIYQRRAELDRQESLGGFPGSFLELARRCFPLDGLDPAHGAYIPIAGHSETTEPLGAAAGFVQPVLDRPGLILAGGRATESAVPPKGQPGHGAAPRRVLSMEEAVMLLRLIRAADRRERAAG